MQGPTVGGQERRKSRVQVHTHHNSHSRRHPQTQAHILCGGLAKENGYRCKHKEQPCGGERQQRTKCNV
eukprot:1161025-Pelagomonas_calceolata.AAC.1